MLIEYVNKAMSKAVYEKLADGTYLGKIPQCPGVIAFGETLYQCLEELRSVLEGWLIVKIRHGDRLPVIGGINLNNKCPLQKKWLPMARASATTPALYSTQISLNPKP